MGSDPQRLVVRDEADAVARARRFTIDRAMSAGWAHLAADAELVVSELVTNGLLHAGPPVELTVEGTETGLRVEVSDSSRVAPLRSMSSEDSMTGRGLALVEAVSARWGAEQRAGGKTIWAELAPGDGDHSDDADRAALAAAWEQVPDDDEPRYDVVLGDVPTDLLLASKAHVDNLVRELTLAAAGSAGQEVPLQLAKLVEAVVHRFAEARQAIRRQALEAAARGEERARLALRLPASLADAGEAYLAGLDQADAFARAARMLTLETPPQYRLFRRWYVESLMTQLRHAAAGEPALPPVSLERRLLDELGVVATAQRASDRAARLHAVAAALAGATTPDAVANVAVAEGIAVLGADRGGLILRDDGGLTIPAAVGHPLAILRRVRDGLDDPRLPIRRTLEDGRPVWIESQTQRDEEFPGLAKLEPESLALCAHPVTVAGDVVGVLRFAFDIPHLFDDDERRFVAALAAQTAQALDRTLVHAAERQARAEAEAYAESLARLQRVTSDLTAVNDVDRVAEVIVDHVAETAGAVLATVSLLVDPQTLEVLAQGPGASGTGWRQYPVDDSTPAGVAVRTGAAVHVRTGAELDARFPALAGQTSGDRPLICLPMRVGGRVIGVISVSFPAGADPEAAGGSRWLATLVDACSQAIDRARALADARAAADKLAFLADASAELASTLDYRTTLANVARLVVPRLADWCSVVLIEEGELRTVAVTHVDPAKVRFAEEIERRYPPTLDQPGGLSEVIGEGRSQLYPVVTDEMLVVGAVDPEHLDLLRTIGMTSVLVVPLTGRTGTFGAITLVTAESGKHYGADDLAFAEDLARRVAVAVENAAAFHRQSGRLAAITRVAEAAQHAILPPVPDRVGPLRLAAVYVSAAREALVGGDLYEVVRRDGGVRLLVGDVRGKGLEAVRLATVVLGEFRAAAVSQPDLAEVARQMDRRLAAYLDDEDFVTAVVADIDDGGTCTLVCCGHPQPFLAHRGAVIPVGTSGSPPLGLGADPRPAQVRLSPGDRLLLFTDGLVEARDATGRFADVDRAVGALTEGSVETVLDRMLEILRDEVGDDLGDDLALLVAEFAPAAAVPAQQGRVRARRA